MEATWKYVGTWGGRSEFRYRGSVSTGTLISWKDKSTRTGWCTQPCLLKNEEYRGMLAHFSDQAAEVGDYRHPRAGSVEDWMSQTYGQWGLNSYWSMILIEEGYAQRVPKLPGHRADRLHFIPR
jgi:hypothetical protein